MNEAPNLTVGGWYRLKPEPPFEVVAVDTQYETVEVQYFDGTLQEFDFDTWMEMTPEPVSAPKDWSGGMDLGKEDFASYSSDGYEAESWNNPIDAIDLYGDNSAHSW